MVNNYRLLKEMNLDLEDDLSLIIGKNNCGKTSLLSILNKFLNNSPNFSFDDFNIEFQDGLRDFVLQNTDLTSRGIYLKLFIEYGEKDDLANVSNLMMDLDPDNNKIILSFGYVLPDDKIDNLKADFNEYISKKPKPEENKKTIFNEFIKKEHGKYFKTFKKTVGYDLQTASINENRYIDLNERKISLDNIINFKIIGATRNVSNNDSNKTLSLLSSKYYEKTEESKKGLDNFKEFKEILCKTDGELEDIYGKLFEDVLTKVRKFGGINEGDSTIKLVSNLQHKELLGGNTTVVYEHNKEHLLPESYNGLGYLNLISMIFEIELILSDFRRENKEDKNPADINILFIEEPEAHTHPQMQSVFIKNIKELLKTESGNSDGTEFNLQTIITSHSSHIVSESDFEDIKYFYKKSQNEVIAKNLKDLKSEYLGAGEDAYYKFLKQFLTLNRAELFFADKAILIEGDTEKILLPAMMKKIDQEFPENMPLLSQNISIVESGAYSHIFEKFIDFIGIKSLIITDLDSAKKEPVLNNKGEQETYDNGNPKYTTGKVKVFEGNITTNASLKFFHGKRENLDYFLGLSCESKRLSKNKTTKNWETDENGNLMVIFQVEESNCNDEKYCARSFEDAFFHLNRKYVCDNIGNFPSLQYKKYVADQTKDVYTLAEKCIDKKPAFAIEILLNSKDTENGKMFGNWKTPKYIREGLIWLKNC
uniref:Uncharacterized protein n=2 Tax=Methanococcus maripaludis TaxID=39152 RepID=A6VF48_METM7